MKCLAVASVTGRTSSCQCKRIETLVTAVAFLFASEFPFPFPTCLFSFSFPFSSPFLFLKPPNNSHLFFPNAGPCKSGGLCCHKCNAGFRFKRLSWVHMTSPWWIAMHIVIADLPSSVSRGKDMCRE